MASALRKMTSVGADVRQIAALLQAKAPKGHMLAYITPQEAALLKAEGGSGKPHEDTGIPSFEDESGGNEFYSVGDAAQTGGSEPQFLDPISYSPPPENSIFQTSPVDYQSEFQGDVAGSGFRSFKSPGGLGMTADGNVGLRATPASMPTPTLTAGGPRPEYAITTRQDATGAATEAATPEKSLMDRAASTTGMSKDTLVRLGIAGIAGIAGASASKKAAEEGQAGKREIQAVAAPYQARGQELQAAAQRGELTPTGQQAIAAARAQAAQGAQARGGVGAQQTEAQVQALRQQLLQQQYDYGLKLSGIGDQMALGAIRTGMQADQYANQLTSSYYNNIARIVAGTPTARAEA
jgi:hypothetical protein